MSKHHRESNSKKIKENEYKFHKDKTACDISTLKKEQFRYYTNKQDKRQRPTSFTKEVSIVIDSEKNTCNDEYSSLIGFKSLIKSDSTQCNSNVEKVRSTVRPKLELSNKDPEKRLFEIAPQSVHCRANSKSKPSNKIKKNMVLKNDSSNIWNIMKTLNNRKTSNCLNLERYQSFKIKNNDIHTSLNKLEDFKYT